VKKMAKLMLVEDDNNLREIYEARLQAEGYDIVSAHDGEEALVVAKAEKPDLIISDVMMPKISGFEMLDIIRNTDGLKDVKIIMLTALGQTDDQQRADRLGADRYLVKSQVTLEDIVKVAHELLQDTPDAAPAADVLPSTVQAAGTDATTPPQPPATTPPDPAPAQTPPPAPVQTPAADPVNSVDSATPQTEASEAAAVDNQIETFVAGADSAPSPVSSDSVPPQTSDNVPLADNSASTVVPPEPATPSDITPIENSHVPIANKKVITPLQTPDKKDITELLAEEEAGSAPAQFPHSGDIAPPSQSDGPVSEDGQIDPHSIAL